MKLNLQDTFSKELPADPIREQSRRQVTNACFSYATPRVPSNPSLLHVSDEMLEALDLSKEDAASEAFLSIFSGAKVIEGSDPYAMCYGGFQFGNWAGQLGDGRATNLGEVVHNDQRWALQLKGAGETPYSRRADGLAVLRSSIREHLCSEAMYHLGVPTTRSLSLALTGDEVLRDMMYDGNTAYEKGAVVCRMAPSFIRFGNFQILAANKDTDTLRVLTDYTIKHFFPEIKVGSKESYLQFFREVASRTLDMVIHWQRVGFVHGVMNTDNMSILGLTIDYGPYGWLEDYDYNWTPNTTDKAHRRYRYGNQPNITLWNVAQLGHSLLALIEDEQALKSVLEEYKRNYVERYHHMMASKVGLENSTPEDRKLFIRLEEILQLSEADMTIFYRELTNVDQDSNDALEVIQSAFYKPEEITGDIAEQWSQWLNDYKVRLKNEDRTAAERKIAMDKVNPKYVLRNYMAQLAIDKADLGDYTLIAEFYEMLKRPYEDQPEMNQWYAKRPDWARHKVGCSMLSCSS